MILDLDDKVEAPLILKRPLLATSQALIDVKDGRIVLRFEEEKVVFKLQEAMWYLMDCDDSCYFLDHIDDCVTDVMQGSLLKDKLDDLLVEEPTGEV